MFGFIFLPFLIPIPPLYAQLGVRPPDAWQQHFVALLLRPSSSAEGEQPGGASLAVSALAPSSPSAISTLASSSPATIDDLVEALEAWGLQAPPRLLQQLTVRRGGGGGEGGRGAPTLTRRVGKDKAAPYRALGISQTY